MSMVIQETRQALEQYLQALIEHDDFGAYFSDDVVVAFAATDQRADGREAATQLISAAHELGEIRMGDSFVSEGHAATEAEFIRLLARLYPRNGLPHRPSRSAFDDGALGTLVAVRGNGQSHQQPG